MSEKPRSDTGYPDPDESPFETPPIEGMPYERGSEEDLAIRRVIQRTERERATSPGFAPDESPFETPPIEGMPYKRGSEEDLAIRRVIDRTK